MINYASETERYTTLMEQAGPDAMLVLCKTGDEPKAHTPVSCGQPHVHIETYEGQWTLAEYAAFKIVSERTFPTLPDALRVAFAEDYTVLVEVHKPY